jgi:hypothetical protein
MACMGLVGQNSFYTGFASVKLRSILQFSDASEPLEITARICYNPLMARTSWHPAFAQAIENELEDSKDALTFETEYQLTTEPLRIDVLVIKKKRNAVIKKNIGQIFCFITVIEYKSPEDSVTIENYHKTHCYSRLYAALNKVDIDDMSVTVVATRHPRKLLTFLKSRYTVENVLPGIYYVEGDTSPTQILVSEELPEEDNFWLSNLRNDLTKEQLSRVFTAAHGRAKIDAYVYAIGEANIPAMEELFMQKKKGVILSEKLDAYFTERLAIPREVEARRNMILEFLRGRFGRIPKNIEKAVNQMNDPIALQSLAARTGSCTTLDEFAAEL